MKHKTRSKRRLAVVIDARVDQLARYIIVKAGTKERNIKLDTADKLMFSLLLLRDCGLVKFRWRKQSAFWFPAGAEGEARRAYPWRRVELPDSDPDEKQAQAFIEAISKIVIEDKLDAAVHTVNDFFDPIEAGELTVAGWDEKGWMLLRPTALEACTKQWTRTTVSPPVVGDISLSIIGFDGVGDALEEYRNPSL